MRVVIDRGKARWCEAYAFAGRHSRPTLPSALSISGQNSSMIANVVIEPTRPFDQNTFHVTTGADHRQAERILGAVAEHQRQRERRQWDADLLGDITDNAESSISQMSNIAFWMA